LPPKQARGDDGPYQPLRAAHDALLSRAGDYERAIALNADPVSAPSSRGG